MTEHLERDVREIRYKVDGLDKSVDLLLRANRKEIVTDLMIFFGKSKDRVKVFLAVDGERTVNELVKKLKPMRQPHVSTRIGELLAEDLIYVKKTTRQGKIYDKTTKVKILNIEKELTKKFGIKSV
ncbi:MAG: hypothetical protein WAN47_09235 [Nitrosotalea sp.]